MLYINDILQYVIFWDWLEISAGCMYKYFVLFLIFIFSCVKFQESNDKTQLIFGAITNIQAKDAAPVEVNADTDFEKLKIIMLCTQIGK